MIAIAFYLATGGNESCSSSEVDDYIPRYIFKNRKWMDEIARGALTTKRPPLPEQMTDAAADAVFRDFSCEPMLKTKWGIKKTHLYKGRLRNQSRSGGADFI